MTDGAELEVRRFRPGDAETLVAVHRRALRDAGSDPDDVPGTADLHRVEAAFLDTGGEFLVGVDGTGTVVAMGGLVVDGATGELFRVAVDPDHQRRGYGGAVLDGLERAARERGVERLELTTASRQAAAVAFYAARGYAETGRERYGEYELVRLVKRLD